MGSIGAILKYLEDVPALVRMKIAQKHALKQILSEPDLVTGSNHVVSAETELAIRFRSGNRNIWLKQGKSNIIQMREI